MALLQANEDGSQEICTNQFFMESKRNTDKKSPVKFFKQL